MSKPVDYGLWQSPLDIEVLFKGSVEPMYPFRDDGQLYWLQALPEEAGRIALHCRQGDSVKVLTPSPFDLRSSVHEYGGRCFAVSNGEIIFNHRKDGCLYRQPLSGDSTPQPLTDGDFDGHPIQFADLVVSPDGSCLLAVAEIFKNSENENLIVCIDLQAESVTAIMPLIRNADFYAGPVFAEDSRQLAWLEWSHPDMPWDQTRLKCAELIRGNKSFRISNELMIADQLGQSICQIGWLDTDSLAYVADHDVDQADDPRGFWNFYRWQRQGNRHETITSDLAEYGEAHWVFGQKRWVSLPGNKILAIRSDAAGDQLCRIDCSSGQVEVKVETTAACQHLHWSVQYPDELLWITYGRSYSGELSIMDLSNDLVTVDQKSPAVLEPEQISEAQAIEYPTRDGEHAYAYYYPPCNPAYSAPPDSRPPLLVMVHGGPTGRADSRFAVLKQYFTSSGFAIIDVNHRGSTGSGRQYRQQLLGQWGEIDAGDIADAIQYVITRNWVNPDLVFIRGSSAGGYAVLRALTQYSELFAGGACYYGIGNLITLASITHKFEARYTDNLIGEVFDPDTADSLDSRFHQRSPVFDIEQLTSPVILFQGLDDRVVPAEVSREVITRLRQIGTPHEYHEYEGEGHGFRSASTRIDSLSREMAFYQSLSNIINNINK